MSALAIATHLEDADPATWFKVREAFAEALGLDEDEVEFDARIIADLGAESLDFLDIAFRLERAFDVKIPRGGIEHAAKEGTGEEDYEIDGVLTDKARASLIEAMPEVSPEEFGPGLKSAQVPELFRVGTFYNLVVHLVNEKAKA